MSIDRRITNGLAWAGVVIVVGIPAADLLSAQFSGEPAPAQIAVIAPVAPVPAPLSQRPAAPAVESQTEVAAIVPARPAAPVAKPAVTPAAQTADVVDAFLQSGRPLPSYITGAPAAAPTEVATTTPTRTPIVTTPAAAEIDPIEVAAIPPQKIAPVPMPLSMRPQSVVAVAPPAVVIPPSVGLPPANVTAADLQDWETGPLSEFLAERQQQAGNAYVDPGYDPNGFYLDEGPNRSRARVIAREVDSFFFVD